MRDLASLYAEGYTIVRRAGHAPTEAVLAASSSSALDLLDCVGPEAAPPNDDGSSDPLQLEQLQPPTSPGSWALQRRDLYAVFPAPELRARLTIPKNPPSLSKIEPSPGRLVMVEVKDLAFEAGSFEPLFGTIFAYDASRQMRVSEEFHFDFNTEQMRTMISDNIGAVIERFTTAKKALLTVHCPSPDIWLFLRVEKVLHGRTGLLHEVYAKGRDSSSKDMTKVQQSCRDACARMGQLREVLCWGCQQLFRPVTPNKPDEGLCVPSAMTNFQPLFRHDPDVDILTALPLCSTGSSKKLSPLRGRCAATVTEIPTEQTVPCRVTPSLVEMKPFPNSTPLVRSLQSFDNLYDPKPRTSWVDNLYIYPKDINFKHLTERHHLLFTFYNFRASKKLSKPEKHWLANKKPLFRVGVKLVSSVRPSDKCLHKFFAAQGTSLENLRERMKELSSARAEEVAQFFPLVMRELFRAMLSEKAISFDAFQTFINILVLMDRGLKANGAQPILETYAEYFLSEIDSGTPELCLAEVLCTHWITLLSDSAYMEMCDHACKFAWFLFHVMYKSMVLWGDGKLCTVFPRSKRFPASLLTQIFRLTILLRSSAEQWGRQLSRSIARFFKDLLCVVDRGRMFEMIKNFAFGMAQEAEIFSVLSKLEFLRELCDHEHFIQLNLPAELIEVPQTDPPRLSFRIYPSRNCQNYLADLVMFVADYHLNKVFQQEIRSAAAMLIRDLLLTLEHDPRIRDVQSRHKVANMFLPVIDTVSYHVSDLIADEGLYEFSRNIFSCFVWVIKNAERSRMEAWFQQNADLPTILLFFDALSAAVKAFRFQTEEEAAEMDKGKDISKDTKSKTRVQDARKTLTIRDPSLPKILVQGPSEDNKVVEGGWPYEYNVKMELTLSTEVNLVALEIVERFAKSIAAELQSGVLSEQSQSLLDKVVSVYATMLEERTSAQFVTRLFASLRFFIHTFPEQMYRQKTTYCADFCRHCIHHCNSGNQDVRVAASTFLYTMMKKNNETTRPPPTPQTKKKERKSAPVEKGNFNRVKVQSTIGLSNLVVKSGVTSIAFLYRAMSTIQQYNELENICEVEEDIPDDPEPEKPKEAKPPDQAKEAAPAPDAAKTPSPRFFKPEDPKPAPPIASKSPSPKPVDHPPVATATPTPVVKKVVFSVKREMCAACASAVYIQERVSPIDGVVFHRNCFRCAHCNKQLQPESFQRVQTSYYCKPHWTQLFANRRIERTIATIEKTAEESDSEEDSKSIVSTKSEMSLKDVPVAADKPAATTAGTEKQPSAAATPEAAPRPSTEPADATAGDDKKKRKKRDGDKDDKHRKHRHRDKSEHAEERKKKKGRRKTRVVARLSPFGLQVLELLDRLTLVLSDSVKLNRYKDDPEMTADLYHRIARSYMGAPALRITWLDVLASRHMQNGFIAEAAMCFAHMCAFIAEYLQLLHKGAKPWIPAGCKMFVGISKNIVEEAFLEEARPDEEGFCDTSDFTEEGLIHRMEQASRAFEAAELYETRYEVSKLLLPLYENGRMYKEMSLTFKELSLGYDKVIETNVTNMRLLGTYYRIGLYGNLLEELKGREYVHRELKLTRLGDIQERLLEQYRKRFSSLSESAIQIFRDSGAVPEDKANSPDTIYIQITKVEPYFTKEEIKSRPMFFDRCNAIEKFFFEAPFTKGKENPYSDDLAQQYKRRTIITVEKQFPYMKNRLAVVKHETSELTPIEVATETVMSQTEKLRNECRVDNPNEKTLLQLLQGSCLVMVQAGPAQIARVFLDDGAREQWETERVKDLAHALSDFLKAVHEALQVHEHVMTPEHSALHREMQQSYHKVNAEITKFILQSQTSVASRQQRPATVPLSAILAGAGASGSVANGSSGDSPPSHSLASEDSVVLDPGQATTPIPSGTDSPKPASPALVLIHKRERDVGSPVITARKPMTMTEPQRATLATAARAQALRVQAVVHASAALAEEALNASRVAQSPLVVAPAPQVATAPPSAMLVPSSLTPELGRAAATSPKMRRKSTESPES
eukprot:m51a1_g6446 putative dock6 protein (2019) ;mRNA; r:397671-405125